MLVDLAEFACDTGKSPIGADAALQKTEAPTLADHGVSSQPADILHDLKAALRDAGEGSPAVKVGIVDGIPDLTHPALRTASVEIFEAMIPSAAYEPDAHGTGICSVIFGQSKPLKGLAPRCSGLVLPIFFQSQKEDRPRPVSQLDLARAIGFALENDVAIINVSAGQKVSAAEADAHLDRVLHRCAERNVLVVAAAGNDGCACLHLPAALESVLAVGAIDSDGCPLPSSNWGESYRINGILAPGDGLLVAVPGGDMRTARGTSYAAAVVSGVAALLLTIARRKSYDVNGVDIRRILLESATPCELVGENACDRYLAGSLNAAAALSMLHQIGRAKSKTRPLLSTIPSIGSVTVQHQLSSGNHAMTTLELEPSAAASVEPSCEEVSSCSSHAKAEDAGKARDLRQKPFLTKSAAAEDTINQLGCSCGCGGHPPQIVYALGSLYYDFGTEARRDLFVQQLHPNHPSFPTDTEIIALIREHPEFAAGLTFTLMQEQVPLYAIQPSGPFALRTYSALLDAWASSLTEDGGEQRVSLPGFIAGSTHLLNGMVVPIVVPDLRGMYTWLSKDLIDATREAIEEAPETEVSDEALLNFLNRIYYALRNLGVAPQDRALNFAATNAYQARQVFVDAAVRGLTLDDIRIVKSPICRPDSDCWDVELSMFDDDNERRADRVYRYTIDVSDVIPVTVGTLRTWAARTSKS